MDERVRSAAACPICAGPPIPRVVWLHTLSRADTRRRHAWYAQPCTACGLALGVHQTYRHPHPARCGSVQCVGFCGAETEEVRQETRGDGETRA